MGHIGIREADSSAGLRSIHLRDYAVVYIDIMGTKSILASEDEQKVIDFIQNLADLYHSMSELHIEKRIFSDNIMIFDDYSEENLQRMVSIACRTQCYLLMRYNLLSRGGIVRGKLYHDENFVIGKGLVDAYKIESEIAVSPRIVLSDGLSADLPNTCKSVSDGRVMVDYMSQFYDEYDEIPDYEQVKEHRRIILQLANADHSELDTKEKERIAFKYGCVVQYHNRFCRQNDLDELLINPDEVTTIAI